MNREIKFRVWDTEQKQFVRWFLSLPDGDVELNDLFIGYWNRSKFYSFQQFTGFIDRNGKEIYEGDIFKSGEYKWEPVEFEDGQWQVHLQGARVFSVFELFDGVPKGDHPVVIGNMFENPELL